MREMNTCPHCGYSLVEMSMIDRVATQLAATAASNNVFELLPDSNKDFYRRMARVALMTLRDPNAAMYDALSAKDKMWRDTNSTEVWQAFIDGALK